MNKPRFSFAKARAAVAVARAKAARGSLNRWFILEGGKVFPRFARARARSQDHNTMRASRRGARDLLVAASRSNARSASYGRFWSTAVRLASARAARGCASGTAPARRCRHRALGARGFAADAADARPPTECWACGAPFGASAEHRFFCDACGEILPARVAAPARGSDGAAPVLFRVLGIAPRFEVDLDALEAAMKRLQKVLHPDKFGARSERARAHSAEQASLEQAVAAAQF